MTKLTHIKYYNEGALFEGLTDRQIEVGRRLRKMYKALTKGLKMDKDEAINKIIYDVEFNSLYGFDDEINERYIKAVLE